MRLYEINERLNDLIEKSIDPETGELNIETEQLVELELAREEKIENIALYIKNLRAEAVAIREEEKMLAERRKSAENKADRLESFLTDSLRGEKFQTSRVAISYRTSSAVEVDNEYAEWAKKVGYDGTLRYKDPEPDKKLIGQLIKSGANFPFARIVQRTSMTIK